MKKKKIIPRNSRPCLTELNSAQIQCYVKSCAVHGKVKNDASLLLKARAAANRYEGSEQDQLRRYC